MTNTHSKNQLPFKASFLSTAISFVMLSGGGVAQAQDGLTEEIIVTGSFIRRSEGLSAASPVTQITSEDIEAQGTLNMAQIVHKKKKERTEIAGQDKFPHHDVEGIATRSLSSYPAVNWS